jgi:hypothetical protein
VSLALLFAVLAVLLDRLIDEPMRSWVEREANRRLEGYSIRLPRADFRLWILSGALYDVSILQRAHPEVPVLRLGAASFDVEWPALFRGRIVGNVEFNEPVLHIDTAQLRQEWNDRIPLKDRGWQQVWELYPLKVDRLKIRNGAVSYIDTASNRKLELSRLMLTAENIRHVTGHGLIYPSPVEATAVVFDSGRLSFAGQANFLLRPHPGFNVVAEMSGVPLEALGTLADDYRVKLRGGILSAQGQLEIAPDRYIANMHKIGLDKLSVDYIAGAQTPKIEQAKETIKEAARYADQSRTLRVRAQELNVTGDFGYLSDTKPQYHVFIDKAKLRLRNFSNRPEQGDSQLALDGLFMGSGTARVRGILRPRQGPTDFALNADIVGTDLRTMNDLLRAHGRLDVSAGHLSVYSQLQVKDGRVRGYVKPLFRDVEVFDPQEDKDDNFFRKLYEAIVGEIAKILENKPRDEVATIVDISGPLQNPDMSSWQVFANLLRNAFVQAILPGFDAQHAPGPGDRKKNDAQPARSD